MWIVFVVGSRPCSERFFFGFSGFAPSTKTNISKFQFSPDRGSAWKPAKDDLTFSLDLVIAELNKDIIPRLYGRNNKKY